MMRHVQILLWFLTLRSGSLAFTVPLPPRGDRISALSRTSYNRVAPSSTTQLSAGGGTIMDVPDGFFTLTFPLLGVMLQVSKQINRARLEERAFDLRLKEARERRLDEDPSLTEAELIREQAAQDISYYGPDAMERRLDGRSPQRTSNNRVVILERNDGSGRRYTLSEEDILELEAMGVEYDPYYDDPYTEDELPDDEPYRQDRRYGDRIYDNGEVFYFDSETGLYYRQGAKPHTNSFWASSRK